jgi:D-alanyl-D-alanine carboxypeptidase
MQLMAAIGRSERISALAVVVAGLICVSPAAASAAATPSSGACPSGQIKTSAGCTTFADARRGVESVIDQSVQDNDLRAALVRIDIGNRTLARVATGDSMAGVPANLRMHYRIGSIAIPFLIDVLLQLDHAGRLSLDDPVSKWYPGYPNADQVTLRMLASATSGYPDWVQENPDFLNELYANPFRQWTSQELLDIALSRPLICDPGQCFHYAHTGFIIISRVIHKVTGKQTEALIHSRVLKPLGLRQTTISALPAMPEPVLHAYTADRGPYEDSTFWSPSWGIAKSTLMSSTVGNVIKAAKAFGTGALVSPEAARERLTPDLTSSFAPFDAFGGSFYYGIGILDYNTWQFQNPEQNGYTAIMAYLPSRKISLALVTTKGTDAAQTSTNFSQRLWSEITAYLTPDHAVNLSL